MVSRESKELPEEGLHPCSPNGQVATADNTEIPGLFQENDDSSSSISIPGFWSESVSEDGDCLWITESCSAVLEPSKDESRDSEGKPKDLPGDFFTLSCPEIVTDEESTSSIGEPTNPEDTQQRKSECHHSNKQQSRSERDHSSKQQSSSERHSNNEQQSSNEQNSNQQQDSGEHDTSNEQQNSNEQHDRDELQNSNEQPSSNEPHNNTEEQTDEPHGNCCATFLGCYNVNSRKIKDSRFIYIFQLFVSLLFVSEIVMGIMFYGNCNPQPSPIPVFAILMAISGLVLIYNWLVKVRRQRRGEYYWNFERNILSVFLGIFLFFLTLEVALFSQASPKAVQSTEEVKCTKTYYDYLYYMLFAVGGSLAVAALLYLPGCCIYIFNYQAPVPSHANGHYQPL